MGSVVVRFDDVVVVVVLVVVVAVVVVAVDVVDVIIVGTASDVVVNCSCDSCCG